MSPPHVLTACVSCTTGATSSWGTCPMSSNYPSSRCPTRASPTTSSWSTWRTSMEWESLSPTPTFIRSVTRIHARIHTHTNMLYQLLTTHQAYNNTCFFQCIQRCGIRSNSLCTPLQHETTTLAVSHSLTSL